MANLLVNLRILTEEENPDEVIAANYTCPNDGYKYAQQVDKLPRYIWYLPACPIDSIVTTLKAQIAAWVTQAYNGSASTTNPFVRTRGIIVWVHTKAAEWVSISTNVDAEYQGFLSNDKRLITWIIEEMKTQGIIG